MVAIAAKSFSICVGAKAKVKVFSHWHVRLILMGRRLAFCQNTLMIVIIITIIIIVIIIVIVIIIIIIIVVIIIFIIVIKIIIVAIIFIIIIILIGCRAAFCKKTLIIVITRLFLSMFISVFNSIDLY